METVQFEELKAMFNKIMDVVTQASTTARVSLVWKQRGGVWLPEEVRNTEDVPLDEEPMEYSIKRVKEGLEKLKDLPQGSGVNGTTYPVQPITNPNKPTGRIVNGVCDKCGAQGKLSKNNNYYCSCWYA